MAREDDELMREWRSRMAKIATPQGRASVGARGQAEYQKRKSQAGRSALGARGKAEFQQRTSGAGRSTLGARARAEFQKRSGQEAFKRGGIGGFGDYRSSLGQDRFAEAPEGDLPYAATPGAPTMPRRRRPRGAIQNYTREQYGGAMGDVGRYADAMRATRGAARSGFANRARQYGANRFRRAEEEMGVQPVRSRFLQRNPYLRGPGGAD